MAKKYTVPFCSVFIFFVFQYAFRDCSFLHCIVGQHRSTTYLNAAYCYRRSSIVRSLSLSVCHDREFYKNRWTDRLGCRPGLAGRPKKNCIRWGSESPDMKGQRWGGGAAHCKVQEFTAVSCAKNGWTDWDARLWCWVASGGPREPFITWSPDPTCEGGNGARLIAKCRDLLQWSVQKNGWTDRYTISDVDYGRPKEPCLRQGCRSPQGKGNFVQHRIWGWVRRWGVQNWVEQS